MQDCSNSIANALELLQSCTKGPDIGFPYETPLQLISQENVFIQNINFSSPIISTFHTEHINNTNSPYPKSLDDWGTVSFEMFQMSFSGYPILQQATQLYKVLYLLCYKTPHGMLLGCLPSFELPSNLHYLMAFSRASKVLTTHKVIKTADQNNMWHSSFNFMLWDSLLNTQHYEGKWS